MYRARLGFLRFSDFAFVAKSENVRKLQEQMAGRGKYKSMTEIKREHRHRGKFKYLMEEVLKEPLIEFGALPLEAEWLEREGSGGRSHNDKLEEFMKHMIEEPFTEFGASALPYHSCKTLAEIHQKHHGSLEHAFDEVLSEPFTEFGAPPQALGGPGERKDKTPGNCLIGKHGN